MEDDVADAGAEVDEDLGRGEARFAEDSADEAGEEFAVHVVGAVFVGAQGFDLERHGTGEGLVEDSFDPGEGEGGSFVGEDAFDGPFGEEVEDEGVVGLDGLVKSGEFVPLNCSPDFAHETCPFIADEFCILC